MYRGSGNVPMGSALSRMRSMDMEGEYIRNDHILRDSMQIEEGDQNFDSLTVESAKNLGNN